jgi:hypothetical protein
LVWKFGVNLSLQDIVIPRGFYVSTSDIWASNSWSDPVFFDVPGIDQDVSDALFQLLIGLKTKYMLMD